ncbi:HD family hydrolase [Stappia sp. F7233]|uniref:HD family hydrolase n=1 Tax=Stappia albiluteola TaxID=2758565 RepID=A0A839AHT6_9HYPH|nr:HD family hydrolase [Stappia albiluteola]MBA5779273.1 HD family hydrolase [Stappia albiluteola]
MAADRPDLPLRAWQRMLSGRRLDLLDPSPLDVEIEDIAHGLARVARWNGQTVGDHAFSVAQHSLLVEELARRLTPSLPPRDCMAVLLHDAPEYVIGDMISPFKAVMGGNYKEIEARLQGAIHLRFSLPRELPATIHKLAKRADTIAAYFEAVELAGFDDREASRIFGRPRGFQADRAGRLRLGLAPLPAAKAQTAFLTRFGELARERQRLELHTGFC